jgi:hypothetical protein
LVGFSEALVALTSFTGSVWQESGTQ